MKYGIVGTGWIAKAFLDGTKLVDGFDEFAVYSRHEETGKKFAENTKIEQVFTDINALAKCNEIEAVYIASPNAFHYEQSKLFLENGKHVICEKPITVTPKELAELTALSREKNLVYMEAIMMLHFPHKDILKDAIGKIGNIRNVHFDFSQRSSKYDALVKGELPNIFNPEFATGCLMDLGIYCVYPAVYYFGIPQDIASVAGLLETGADGYGSSVLIYPDKHINLTYSKISQDRFGSQIMGDQGTITIESISKLINIKLFSNSGEEILLCGDVEKEEIMSYEARDFYAYISDYSAKKKELFMCQDMALQVSKIMEKIRLMSGIKFK